MGCKGQAGSAVSRSSSLLPNLQANRSLLLEIPLAPEPGRYRAEQSLAYLAG